MVVKSFLVAVVLRMPFLRRASAVMLHAIENSHIIKYGSADNRPF